MDYIDLGAGMKSITDLFRFDDLSWKRNENLKEFKVKSPDSLIPPKKRQKSMKPVYQVRPSAVCVVGRNAKAVMKIKESLGQAVEDPLAIESFHVCRTDDLRDGALLVPKVILVATHCPGVKVLDESGDEGQLDALYDEAYECGAEVVVLYMDLPKALYPPLNHGLYHDDVARLLFYSQPLLRFLALHHSLLTVTEQSGGLNPLQMELLINWINTPVARDHPVYLGALRLAAKYSNERGEGWENILPPTYRDARRATESHIDRGLIYATEEHPLVEGRPAASLARVRLGEIFGRYAVRDAVSRRNYGTLEDLQPGSRMARSLSVEDRLTLIPLPDDDNNDDDEVFNDNGCSYQRQLIRTDYL